MLTKIEKGRAVEAETEASQAVIDGDVWIQEGWEEVGSEEVVEDDWVRV